MARRAIRKTDLGTIILHWSLVVLLLIAVTTGLRIAIGAPYDMLWLRRFDFLLPQSTVWTWHIPAGTLLFALAVSYTIYLYKANLFRRVQPDLARLKGLVGRRNARIGALNVILYWMFFLAIVMELVTGILLYLGFAGWVADLHLIGTWIIVAYVPLHCATHLAIGGARQLLRIFNPGKLAPPPVPFDPYDMLAEVLSKTAGAGQPLAVLDGGRHAKAAPVPPSPSPTPKRGQPRRGQILQAHPLAVALGGGFTALMLLMSLDQVSRDELVIGQVDNPAHNPILDGDISDPIWRTATPVYVRTQQGANLEHQGGSMVEIRGVHDGENVYFAFIWNDPTRSLKHLPLIKTAHGWRLMHDKFDHEDANAFFQDKFSVLIVPGYVLIPGDRTFHAGEKPLPGKPESLSGRGFHYTTNGSYVDMWQWKATEGGLAGWVEDGHFGPPTEPTPSQLKGDVPYKGGIAPDPGETPYSLNFDQLGPGGYDGKIRPKRLPKDLAKTTAAMGVIDLDPHRGESEDARWWMPRAESVSYSKEADDAIPVGTVIPGIIGDGALKGDRGDVRCAAKWAAGRWVLEVTRKLKTSSKYDTPIQTDHYLRVAVFDHSQTRHTRHIRPIRLKVETCQSHARCVSTTSDSWLDGEKSF